MREREIEQRKERKGERARARNSAHECVCERECVREREKSKARQRGELTESAGWGKHTENHNV